MQLWDYQSNDENKILAWASDVRLGKRDRAFLDQKLRALVALGFDLATHTHLLAGPLNNSSDKHIFKVRVNASVMVRILVCRGPLPGEDAVTLLAGALERNFKLEPPRALTDAASRRGQVLAAPKVYRRPHERFTK